MVKAQLESPAQLGRQQRIEEFRQFIEANRKIKTEKQIIALYSINNGMTVRLVKSYLQIFYDAGFYVKPGYLSKWKIVTLREYEELSRREEQMKNEELDIGLD